MIVRYLLSEGSDWIKADARCEDVFECLSTRELKIFSHSPRQKKIKQARVKPIAIRIGDTVYDFILKDSGLDPVRKAITGGKE